MLRWDRATASSGPMPLSPTSRTSS
jgi:hypothetical protein